MMQFACTVNVHKDPSCVIDTLESIQAYMTNDILVLVDGASWPVFENINLPAAKMKGFDHNIPKSPYRNMALSLKTVTDMWPNADWYCYCESDVLFSSPKFKQNLEWAAKQNAWMLGNDGHLDDKTMPLIEALLKAKFASCYYMLGCCQFFHQKFIAKLREIDFFDRFLNLSNGFAKGEFPTYKGYDISEHMYPTLCRHFGGNVGVFAHYDEFGKWHGFYESYPMRWKPELDPATEMFPDATILHPLKTVDHPVRVYHREKRLKWIELNQSA